jgi:hypothetical protein
MEYYTPQGIYQKAHKLLEELVQRRTPDIKVCLTYPVVNRILIYDPVEYRAAHLFCLPRYRRANSKSG